MPTFLRRVSDEYAQEAQQTRQSFLMFPKEIEDLSQKEAERERAARIRALQVQRTPLRNYFQLR